MFTMISNVHSSLIVVPSPGITLKFVSPNPGTLQGYRHLAFNFILEALDK